MKLAICLLRVSSDRQMQEGHGLDVQKRANDFYAERNDLIIVRYFTEHFSGRKANRQMLEEVIEYIAANEGEISALIVSQIDRFTRAGADVYLYLQKRLRALGVELLDASGVIQRQQNTLESYGFEYDWSVRSPSRLRGYVDYMGQALGLADQETQSSDPQNFFFARSRSLPIRESDRRLHTYLTGGTGTGKSENIKTLVHHYLTTDTKSALVVIDPHGKLAREIARFKENRDGQRLVYIKPDLKSGIAPTLNPLELKRKTDDAITVQTEEVISVFRELIGSGEGAAKFTTQMEVLLYPCIFTLIHMGEKTLQDLLKFMDPDQAGPYIDYALRNLDNPSHLDFFERIYPQDSYGPTRLAISTRLQSIFHSHPVARFLIGNSTIELESLIEDRALIIFDLGDLGEMSREAIGRFVVASLQSYARRRRIGSTPIHVFIDEAQQFISPSLGRIMKEARKFGLHATLAQQIYGDGMTPKMREIVSGNTAVKITARNADKSLRAFAANTGAELDLLKSLNKYEYLIQSGDSVPVKYRLTPKTLGNRNSMNAAEWKTVLADQITRFYRTVTKPVRSTSKPVPVRYSLTVCGTPWRVGCARTVFRWKRSQRSSVIKWGRV